MKKATYASSAALCSVFLFGLSHAGFVPNLEGSELFKRAVSISTETVGDEVAYTPNLDTGGFATPENRSRYQSHRIAYSFRQSPRSLVSIALSQSQINNLRDSFEVNQIGFERFYRLTPKTKRYSFDIAFGASYSRAESIQKNSYTAYGDNLITRSSIESPQDRTLSLNLIGGIKLRSDLKFNTFVGGGIVRSSHKSVNGMGLSNEGCQYAFSANAAGGSLNQIGTCNAVLSYQQIYASEEDVGDRLGFRPSQDIAYLGKFAEAGAQFNWSSRQFSASLGYRYRHYLRNTIDKNIENAGQTPVNASQIVNAEISYRPSSQWQLSFAATYQDAPFLDHLPMLYTAFTSERYVGESSLSFRLGIAWKFDNIYLN